MKKNIILITSVILFASNSCKPKMENFNNTKTLSMSCIDSATMNNCIDSLKKSFPNTPINDISTGVKQVAKFWTKDDGSKDEFIKFCRENYLPDENGRKIAMEKISRNMEILNGGFNQILLRLKEPVDMNLGDITPIDQMFGGYNPSSNLSEDFFKNKIAFFILLNYKFYSLNEKTNSGIKWNREQWAIARLGDMFASRIPGKIQLNISDINTRAESYISDYNIFMANLVNNRGEKFFPAGMKLITHWGLRDEIKSNYQVENGLEKQKMIYNVMLHIINQDIPSCIINSDKYLWNPFTNKVFNYNNEVTYTTEPDTRYEWLLNNFKALKEADSYNPFFPTYIKSKFESEMEILQRDVEKLFTELLISPQAAKVATLIAKRLNRKLEPFDIWYDGFKKRSTINTAELDKTLKKKYPNSDAFQKDIPNILQKLGFNHEKAIYIASKIQVDAARGSGHAWGAQMKGDKAHLRTRISEDGMDYKGFNIAIHELGHCVEQTLTLYDIDNYLLSGVPNTAFTEALAFVFQKRDLEVLGIKDNGSDSEDLSTLDIFWSNYEIMGVSIVDMNVWEWMYSHPDASKSELKEAVIKIAKDVWNKYYARIFGIKDQPILAVYSHMIDNPLYLSAYPIGYLIEFQIEKAIQGKNFGEEIMRIYSKGRIVPQVWLKEALGQELSNQPLLDSVDKALEKVK